MKRNIANAVTLLRVVLVLPFWLAFGHGGTTGAIIATVCAFFIELSDLLDGTIARKLGVVSDVGKLLDPAADSFSRLAVFLALATHPAPGPSEAWFPAWGVLLLLLRDVGVSFLRQVAASKGVVIAARTSGKIKALAQGAAIWLILGLHLRACFTGGPDGLARNVALGAALAAIFITLVSLVDYVFGVRAVIQGEKTPS
ncbi:MAG: CDP-alcohol phosphatidyltransferase family protein [Planctomycetota bacterium]